MSHYLNLIFGLLSLVYLNSCSQPPQSSQQTTASQITIPAQNEVVVSSTPVTTQTLSTELRGEPSELTQEKTAFISSPVDVLAKNKAIQMALRNANFYTGEIDGKIGPKTKQAIRNFQMSKNLTADGVIGPKTWTELKAYLPEEQAD